MTNPERQPIAALLGELDEALRSPDPLFNPIILSIRNKLEAAIAAQVALWDERRDELLEAARAVVDAQAACNAEGEKPLPSRSSEPMVAYIGAMERLREALRIADLQGKEGPEPR